MSENTPVHIPHFLTRSALRSLVRGMQKDKVNIRFLEDGQFKVTLQNLKYDDKPVPINFVAKGTMESMIARYEAIEETEDRLSKELNELKRYLANYQYQVHSTIQAVQQAPPPGISEQNQEKIDFILSQMNAIEETQPVVAKLGIHCHEYREQLDRCYLLHPTDITKCGDLAQKFAQCSYTDSSAL